MIAILTTNLQSLMDFDNCIPLRGFVKDSRGRMQCFHILRSAVRKIRGCLHQDVSMLRQK